MPDDWKITITPRENKDPRVGGSPYHVLIEQRGIRSGYPAFDLESVVNLISDMIPTRTPQQGGRSDG